MIVTGPLTTQMTLVANHCLLNQVFIYLLLENKNKIDRSVGYFFVVNAAQRHPMWQFSSQMNLFVAAEIRILEKLNS